MSLATPVVFLIFNRPRHTQRVLAEIARARPRRLFVVADGPRPDRPEDAALTAAARALIEEIDWPCEVSKDYSRANLGCKRRVGSGLTSVFEQVEEAIILEDDCIPAPSFFPYCESLLARYRLDERIMSIAGFNYQPAAPQGGHSYYFSKYFHCWGWATWRRAWQHFDMDVASWPAFKTEGGMSSFADTPAEEQYMNRTYDAHHAGQVDSWAYAFSLASYQQSGLHAVPNTNLVSNIGFDDDATHTRLQEHPLANVPRGDLRDLVHPSFVIRDKAADAYTFQHVYHGNRPRGWRKLYRSLSKRVRRWTKARRPSAVIDAARSERAARSSRAA